MRSSQLSYRPELKTERAQMPRAPILLQTLKEQSDPASHGATLSKLNSESKDCVHVDLYSELPRGVTQESLERR